MKISIFSILFFSFCSTISIFGSHIKISGQTSDGIELHHDDLIDISLVKQTLVDLSHSGEPISIEFSDLAKPLIFAPEDIIVTPATIHLVSSDHGFQLTLINEHLSIRMMAKTEVLTLRTVYDRISITSARTDLRDNIIVEVGTSFDQHLLSSMGGIDNFTAHWLSATIDIADAYDRLTDLQLVFSNPIQLNANSKLFINNSKGGATAFFGTAWGTVICRETDVAIHLTGLDIPGGRGHSNSGQNYCNIDNGQYFDMAVVQGYSTGLRVADIAHELGHTLGLGHEDDGQCSLDNGYFMCSFGTSKDHTQWRISSSFRTSVENNAADAPCTGEADETNDCAYCRFSNFVSFGGRTLLPRRGGSISKFVSRNCASDITDEIHEITLETMGGCSTEAHDIQLTATTYNSLPTIEFIDYPSTWQLTEDASTTRLLGVLSVPSDDTEYTSITFRALVIDPNQPTIIPSTIINIQHKRVGQELFSNSYLPADIRLVQKEIIANTPGQKWSEIVQANNLDLYKIDNYKIHVEEDLEIDIDYNFENCKFEFLPQTTLYISDADVSVYGDLEKNSELISCDQRWQGVEIIGNSTVTIDNTTISNTIVGITVEDGADLTVEKLDLTNTLSGIQVNGGGTLLLNKATINGNSTSSGTGIQLHANARASIRSILISKFQFGIKGNNQLGTTGILEGTISNVEAGIWLETSAPMIEYVNTEDCLVGMYLSSCGGSMLSHNTIGYSSVGLVVNHSPSSFVTRNIIGTDSQHGPNGLIMVNSGRSFVLENPMIKANRLGALIVGGEVVMEQCTLAIESAIGVASAGVQLVQNVGTHLVANVIRATETSSAIETIMCTGSNITNNGLFHYSESSERTAAIRSLGSMDETIEANDIDGFFLVSQNGISQASGLMAQNSTVNTYDCNYVDETTEGLGVYYNADFHTIRGNHFLNSLIDLEIRSVVGRQEHHGNVFVNGNARATELTPSGILQSQFIANCTHPTQLNLCPSNPQPASDWFSPTTDIGSFYSCEGIIGPGITPTNNSLCAYYNQLKTHKDSMPEQFFVKLYHLLRLEKIENGYVLPSCIKQDSTLLSMCGLAELVDAKASLDKISQTKASTTQLLAAQAYYTDADFGSKEQAREHLQSEMLAVNTSLMSEVRQDSISLDSLRSEIDLIYCTDSLLVKWKAIMTAYINYAQEGEVEQNDRSMLVMESQACSDRYGDAIHLARALANTYTSTHYDSFDDCISSRTSPRSSFSNTTVISVYPNPSMGQINIDFGRSFTGRILIVDIAGKTIFDSNLDQVSQTNVNLDVAPGVYYLRCRSLDGVESIQKILLID